MDMLLKKRNHMVELPLYIAALKGHTGVMKVILESARAIAGNATTLDLATNAIVANVADTVETKDQDHDKNVTEDQIEHPRDGHTLPPSTPSSPSSPSSPTPQQQPQQNMDWKSLLCESYTPLHAAAIGGRLSCVNMLLPARHGSSPGANAGEARDAAATEGKEDREGDTARRKRSVDERSAEGGLHVDAASSPLSASSFAPGQEVSSVSPVSSVSFTVAVTAAEAEAKRRKTALLHAQATRSGWTTSSGGVCGGVEGGEVTATTTLRAGAQTTPGVGWEGRTVGESALVTIASARELLDWTNKYGQAAIHIAARLGHADVAEALIAAGARVDVKDERGRIPWDIASAHGHATVAGMLQHCPQGKGVSLKKTKKKREQRNRRNGRNGRGGGGGGCGRNGRQHRGGSHVA